MPKRKQTPSVVLASQREEESRIFLKEATEIAEGIAAGAFDKVEISFAEKRRNANAKNKSLDTIRLEITYSGNDYRRHSVRYRRVGQLARKGVPIMGAIDDVRAEFGLSLADAKALVSGHEGYASAVKASEPLHDELERVADAAAREP